jgi:thiamine biosynthesis lipoprotein
MSQKIRIKPLVLGISFTLVFWYVVARLSPVEHADTIYHFEYPFEYFTVNISAHGSPTAINAALDGLPKWLGDFQTKFRQSGPLDSLISTAELHQEIPLDSLSYAMFAFALQFRTYTAGKIDVGIGNLVRAWKQAAATNTTLPDSTRERLVAEMQTPFYRMDSASQSLVILRTGQHFALGAFMEGVILDEIDRRLATAGAQGWLAEVSGDFSYHGVKPNGEPWVLGLKDPYHPENLLAKVKMDPRKFSFCTSGDYEQTHTDAEGAQHHHILDPRTGKSSVGIRSVSVLQSIPGMNKNSLCTWFMLLSLDEIKAQIKASSGQISALVVLDNERVWVDPELAQFTEFLPHNYQIVE